MAELADALESGSSVLIDVGVRLPLSAFSKRPFNEWSFFIAAAESFNWKAFLPLF